MLTRKVGRISRSITPSHHLYPDSQFLPASSLKMRDSSSNAFDGIPAQPSLIQRAHQPRRLISSQYFSALGPSPACRTRGYATKSTEKPAKDQSLFSSHGTPWDQVFHDIDNLPLLPSQILPTRPRPNPSSKHNPNHNNPRRQSMTAREIHAFDQMFNMIFDAVDAQSSSGASTSSSSSMFNASADDEAEFAPIEGASIGLSKTSQSISSLYAHLRRQSGKTKSKWNKSSYLDAELDRKKEEIELCESDAGLVEWALREVFGESVRYEEDARKALGDIAAERNTSLDTSADSESEVKVKVKVKKALPILQPPTYPHLLAHLMRTFRTKHSNPHLSLALFHHAQHLSIPSYVFGCTTPAYNELLLTLWDGFRDVRGVMERVGEMRRNGVVCDSRTREVVERVRREVGGRVVWGEEGGGGGGQGGGQEWGGGGLEEVMGMVGRIEELVMGGQGRGARGTNGGRGMRRDEWKRGGREVAAVAV
ncbi:uncharacterized protein STEHIDRAFT_172954 [Stereum hirsutum FP-91666 SS1]|uniref:Mtf2-like C-terminal domain-containing protein n=1 Tax=Stereum hirsutum (strain FP-91666) TaxID=721885 RepID=R7S089_STEHR|nr:uncharacterized protein STEHIDRAFT_172954 [Stereum hirsutum FP-91666 SS1]EIM79987.1 hypothetical protein STEHIDRAFT_172954 [Stereum hirsutum FP-91666 SS1]